MLCAPDDGGGAGGNPPPAPSPAPIPEPPKEEKKDEKKDPPTPKDGPMDLVVRDVARIKKHVGLDEDKPAPAKKKSGGFSVFSLFDKDE
jgi:hypothetical protein